MNDMSQEGIVVSTRVRYGSEAAVEPRGVWVAALRSKPATQTGVSDLLDRVTAYGGKADRLRQLSMSS